MLSVQNVTFRYDEGAKPALDGITLDVQKGEYVAILGANGCGKSTLAKHFNAILLPESGRVLVEGMPTSDEKNLLALRQKVGMVFQNPDNQIVATVVEEDVAFAAENLGVEPHEMRRRVDEAMQLAGIYAYKDKAPHKLSGGQKQRVAIAGVLAMQPDCLVLDEATAMLDPVGRRETVDTIRTLNEKFGITVILITHHMDEAAQAQRLIVMADGHIIDDGAPTEVFQHVDTLRNAGLAVPETVGLLYELRKEGLNVPLDAISDEACAAVLAGLLR